MSEEDVGELRALNARFIHNFVTRDVASHDDITHEKFVCISAKGAREAKAPYLERWAYWFDPEVFVYWDYRDEHITLFGSTALVGATNRYVLRSKEGEERAGMTAYTDTYVKANGRWVCVQAQLTEVSPENYPPDETIVKIYLKGVVQ